MNKWVQDQLARFIRRNSLMRPTFAEQRTTQPKHGFGWVISCQYQHGTLYWTGHGLVDFSPNPKDAVQFTREQDAVIVRNWVLRNPFLRVHGHAWSH